VVLTGLAVILCGLAVGRFDPPDDPQPHSSDNGKAGDVEMLDNFSTKPIESDEHQVEELEEP